MSDRNIPNEHGVGLRAEIEQSLNRWSAEGRSNTPDFILAKFLIGCLNAFDVAVNSREEWYGRNPMRIVRACCRMLAGPDDMVIYRDAFRWKNDANEHVMPNHYESQSLQYLAEEHGYEIVHDFRHVGVVRRKA
jgi:hypothetical protein